MKKNIIILTSLLSILLLVLITISIIIDDDNYPKVLKNEIEEAKESGNFIVLNQEYTFGKKEIYIYGVSFEMGNRNKPIVYYNAFDNSGNTSLNCIDPPITGGGRNSRKRNL